MISLVLVPIRLSITEVFSVCRVRFIHCSLKIIVKFLHHTGTNPSIRYIAISRPSAHCPLPIAPIFIFCQTVDAGLKVPAFLVLFAVSATKSFFCGLKRFVNRSYLDRRLARGSTHFAVNCNPVGYWARATIQTPPRVSAFSYLRGLFCGPVQLELSVCDREDAPKS